MLLYWKVILLLSFYLSFQWHLTIYEPFILENIFPWLPGHQSHFSSFLLPPRLPFLSLLDCVNLWTVVCQDPLSMGFSRQEYWSGLPSPPLGDSPNPGIKPSSHKSPALAGGFFTTSTTWKVPPPQAPRTFISNCKIINSIEMIISTSKLPLLQVNMPHCTSSSEDFFVSFHRNSIL